MKVISLKICPFVQRVTATLEAKKIPYEIEYITFSNTPEWFLQISPNSQVPVLVTDNGTALFESDAIVEYLDDVYAPLQSEISAEQKALNRAWSYQASQNYLVQCSAMQSPDKKTFSERSERLNQLFSKVEKAKTNVAFFNGETINNVDIAWLPLLHRAKLIEQYSDFDFFTNFPKIKKWQKLMLEQGIAEKSVSQDFNQVFSDFYLSDRTYLGKRTDSTSDSSNSSPSNNCCC